MSEKNLTQKLIHVQKELKAPKGNFNSFGKYKYRSAEDILEAVKPLNAEQGLLLTLSDEPHLVGNWNYIQAKATITDGVDSHTVTAYARESETKKGMDHSQITGTASSYARKYALNGLYLIDDTKDADTDEYQQQNQEKNITQKQVGELKLAAMKFAEMRNGTIEQVYETLKITDVTKLTESQAKANITKVKAWIAKAEKEESK